MINYNCIKEDHHTAFKRFPTGILKYECLAFQCVVTFCSKSTKWYNGTATDWLTGLNRYADNLARH